MNKDITATYNMLSMQTIENLLSKGRVDHKLIFRKNKQTNKNTSSFDENCIVIQKIKHRAEYTPLKWRDQDNWMVI